MMYPDSIIFAGVEVASGRKPVTFAALDDDLKVTSLAQWGISEALTCLQEYGSIRLVISIPATERAIDYDFKQRITEAGFTTYPKQNDSRQLLLTNAQDCFRGLIGKKPLPRRTLEGRLQRSAILYEEGLQIPDPIDVFEEFTRYRLRQGILPMENIHSPKELDALVAAYVAWLAVNRPGQIASMGGVVLPAKE